MTAFRRIGRHMLGRVFDVGSGTFPQVALSPSLLDNMIGVANNWLAQGEEREARLREENQYLRRKLKEWEHGYRSVGGSLVQIEADSPRQLELFPTTPTEVVSRT